MFITGQTRNSMKQIRCVIRQQWIRNHQSTNFKTPNCVIDFVLVAIPQNVSDPSKNFYQLRCVGFAKIIFNSFLEIFTKSKDMTDVLLRAPFRLVDFINLLLMASKILHKNAYFPWYTFYCQFIFVHRKFT